MVPTSAPPRAPALDPFAATTDGCYRDDLIEVRPGSWPPSRRTLTTVRTTHFDVQRCGAKVIIEHRVATWQINDGLGGLLREELFAPGWLAGADLFERVFTGIVLTSADDPFVAWRLFYDNTLAQLRTGSATSSLADYAPVYSHAVDLTLPGSVLELGSCFGFLALTLAGRGHPTTATDLSGNTMRLLSVVASGLDIGLETLACDAAAVPLADQSATTVMAVHLLEHVSEPHGVRVLAEALRLARERVVIGVPLEEEPNPTWGHLRAITLDDLHSWGRATGLPFEVHEHHGGWLVLEL